MCHGTSTSGDCACPNKTMNPVTCAFAFPIRRCDDTVQDIDTEAKYFIALDMDSGYCKLVEEEEAQ